MEEVEELIKLKKELRKHYNKLKLFCNEVSELSNEYAIRSELKENLIKIINQDIHIFYLRLEKIKERLRE